MRYRRLELESLGTLQIFWVMDYKTLFTMDGFVDSKRNRVDQK